MANNSPITTINDDHLEMLTRIRVRAEERELSRCQIWDKAYMIIEMAQAIIGQPMAQNLASTSMLNALEQPKEVLVEEMAKLKLE